MIPLTPSLAPHTNQASFADVGAALPQERQQCCGCGVPPLVSRPVPPQQAKRCHPKHVSQQWLLTSSFTKFGYL